MKRALALSLLALATLTPLTLAQDQPARPDPAQQFGAKLGALRPGDAKSYFELGEEIADARRDAAGRRLASELWVIAYWTDLKDGDTNAIAASACLALASLPGNARYESWLRALTHRLTPVTARPESARALGSGGSDSLAYQLALVLGYVRSGDGGLANRLMDRTEIASALATIDRLLIHLGVTDGAAGIRHEASRWPCPDCGNDHIVRRAQTSPPTWKFCPTCGGLSGEQINNAQLLAHLRAESFLLEGVQKSWAAQITTDQGAPLIDPDPESLPSVFGIDPARSVFKDGKWIKPD